MPAASIRPLPAGCVRFVNDQMRVKAIREFDQFGERRGVAFHAKERFGDNEPRLLRAAARMLALHQLCKIIGIVMCKNDLLGAAQTQAVDDRSMVALVGKNEIASLDDGAQQALVGDVAARQDDRCFRTVPGGEFGFDVLPDRMVPAQQARRSAAACKT
jgi:hypothetical protein